MLHPVSRAASASCIVSGWFFPSWEEPRLKPPSPQPLGGWACPPSSWILVWPEKESQEMCLPLWAPYPLKQNRLVVSLYRWGVTCLGEGGVHYLGALHSSPEENSVLHQDNTAFGTSQLGICLHECEGPNVICKLNGLYSEIPSLLSASTFPHQPFPGSKPL